MRYRSSCKVIQLAVGQRLRVPGRCEVEAEACRLQRCLVLLQSLQVLLQRSRAMLRATLWRSACCKHLTASGCRGLSLH